MQANDLGWLLFLIVPVVLFYVVGFAVDFLTKREVPDKPRAK